MTIASTVFAVNQCQEVFYQYFTAKPRINNIDEQGNIRLAFSVGIFDVEIERTATHCKGSVIVNDVEVLKTPNLGFAAVCKTIHEFLRLQSLMINNSINEVTTGRRRNA